MKIDVNGLVNVNGNGNMRTEVHSATVLGDHPMWRKTSLRKISAVLKLTLTEKIENRFRHRRQCSQSSLAANVRDKCKREQKKNRKWKTENGKQKREKGSEIQFSILLGSQVNLLMDKCKSEQKTKKQKQKMENKKLENRQLKTANEIQFPILLGSRVNLLRDKCLKQRAKNRNEKQKMENRK